MGRNGDSNRLVNLSCQTGGRRQLRVDRGSSLINKGELKMAKAPAK